MKKKSVAILVLLLATLIIIWIVQQSPFHSPVPVVEPVTVNWNANPVYRGSESCRTCHTQAFNDWQGSHHQQAMQHANPETVLADFNDSRFVYDQVESSFYVREGKYYVTTDGSDGKLAEFEIKYTFGVTPLQQYLVELDRGRLQALSIAWDTRPKEQGGQRWFHLYPDENVDYQDELHWTKISQNWNYMCSECHSTDLHKNYHSQTDQFKTTWAEISVGCEACHGAGSKHIDWAEHLAGWEAIQDFGLPVRFNERQGINWNWEESKTTAQRSQPRLTQLEIETCARCHSRRSLLNEDYQPGQSLMNTHLPALLTESLYHPDGQIKAEDYVYGSFLQSKMFHQGVTCSDCHEPHSLKLRQPGNGVCLQCHQKDHYETREHHFHDPQSQGGACAECHMPPQVYMGVDARHDHSFRIPRPDLSLSIQVPNACTQCHINQTDTWAQQALDDWYGVKERDWHFGQALYDAVQGEPNAAQDLLAVAAAPYLPDIARATAASLLSEALNPYTLAVLPRLLNDQSAMVRRAALLVVDRLPAQERWNVVGRLLNDPVFAVRIEAARVLAVIPLNTLNPQQRQDLQQGIAGYLAAQKANAEHPQAQVNMGLLYLRMGQMAEAEAAYQQALRLDARFAAASVNLADLYRLQDQEVKAEPVLLKAKDLMPNDASIQHALGLLYIRSGKMLQALSALAQATEFMPDNIHYGYVYAVALESAGQIEKALKKLQQLNDQQSANTDVLWALVTYSQKVGKQEQALLYAQKLAEIQPQFGNVEQILKQAQ